jgi:DNA-binding NarL/FixJ family response regulator
VKEKITLSIYDGNRLQKELLHHQLERLRFDVLYSTTKQSELEEYFRQRPADVLLVNGQNYFSEFISCIKALRKRSGKLKVIFYNTGFDDSMLAEVNGVRGVKCFSVAEGWANLLDRIEELSAPQRQPDKEINLPSHLTAGNPFSKISGNPKYVDILRYLKEGKSNRQIAYLTNSSIDSVKYCIKKMHDETGSNTTKMVADAIKAGVI